MEMALRNTTPMNDEEEPEELDIAPNPQEDLRKDLPHFDPGNQHQLLQYEPIVAADHHLDNHDMHAMCDDTYGQHILPTDHCEPSDYQAAAAVIAARRHTTCSTEDALAGMLWDTILSPQTVIEHHREAAIEAPELASATKPKISKVEAAAASPAGGVDLRALMSLGALDAAKEKDGMYPGMMSLSPGLLAGLSAELCATENGEGGAGKLPVIRELFN